MVFWDKKKVGDRKKQSKAMQGMGEMKYILLEIQHLPTRRKILCVKELDLVKTLHFLRKRYYAIEVMKPPCKRTLRRWMQKKRQRAVCGCWIGVNSGERCPTHFCMSWASALIGVR